jgi:hypothetical protein
MPTRQKRLVMVGGVFLFIVTLGWNLLSDARRAPASIYPPAPLPSLTAAEVPTPMITPASPSSGEAARFEYAIALVELDGLAPDVDPGTLFDLWVTWEPPLVDQPDVRPLLRAVVLERVIPPVVPEGPTVAVLGIPRTKSAVRALVYGDQYGKLSVVRAADL